MRVDAWSWWALSGVAATAGMTMAITAVNAGWPRPTEATEPPRRAEQPEQSRLRTRPSTRRPNQPRRGSRRTDQPTSRPEQRGDGATGTTRSDRRRCDDDDRVTSGAGR